MIKFAEHDIILAIESAVSGGSVGLYSGGMAIDSWVGAGGVSRAEDLLPNIAEMLERNSIERRSIAGIAVSIGPGSFTGIRIGIATALGLKTALNIPCIGVSALEAIAVEANTGRVAAALPMGRGAFCFQGLELGKGGIETLFGPFASRTVPKEMIADHGIERMVVHQSIMEQVASELPGVLIMDAGTDLSSRIAAAAMIPAMQRSLEPIFLSLAANV
ncbi:MAG: tRNA (adenosine(37)-N6)-threonylcarbamoyltransferase complex dimerization subunit type 1 TsaB [Acidobacteriota bacterium]